MTLLTPKEASEMLKVSLSTLRLWRKLKKGPPVARLEGSYRYTREEIENYVREKVTRG